MTNPVDTSDLEAHWRPLASDELIVASTLLDYAWAVIVANVAAVEARLADETLDRALVAGVVSMAVRRVMENPGGYRQETETIGDTTYSFTRDAVAATGLLYITPEELAVLAAPGMNTSAFTITPYGAPPGGSPEPTLWL